MTHAEKQASYVNCSPPRHGAIANKVGILRRAFGAFLDAMYELRRRIAEREIANFVVRRGGRITDDLEREVTRRLLTSNWSPRE